VLDSKGFSLLATDDEIWAGQAQMAGTSGIFAEPAAAAVMAGLAKISRRKLLNRDDQIVLLVTGHGLKDIDAPLAKLRLPKPVAPKLEAVKDI
jgi:threonine synthase